MLAYMELTMVSFLMAIAVPEDALLSLRMSVMLSTFLVVPLKKMLLSVVEDRG